MLSGISARVIADRKNKNQYFLAFRGPPNTGFPLPPWPFAFKFISPFGSSGVLSLFTRVVNVFPPSRVQLRWYFS
jgi:hypothetical protein